MDEGTRTLMLYTSPWYSANEYYSVEDNDDSLGHVSLSGSMLPSNTNPTLTFLLHSRNNALSRSQEAKANNLISFALLLYCLHVAFKYALCMRSKLTSFSNSAYLLSQFMTSPTNSASFTLYSSCNRINFVFAL